MKKKTNAFYGVIMALSLILVVALTSFMWMTPVSTAAHTVLALADICAAGVFSACSSKIFKSMDTSHVH